MKLFGKYHSLSHWFSYNWGWVLGGILLLAFILSAAFLHPNDPEADYLVSWVGVSALTAEEEQTITNTLSRSGQDQNGDGDVTVQIRQFIIDFTLTSSDDGFEDNYSYVLKLVAELQTEQCYLFLMDQPEQFQRSIGALQYLDGTTPSNIEGSGYDSEYWEQMCVAFHAEGLERQTYLGRRAFFGDRDISALFPGSDALFNAIAGQS